MRDEWRIMVTNSLRSSLLPMVFKTKREATKELRDRAKLIGFKLTVVQTRVVVLK